jgi:tetratricopeptide (TPR) repeat protein
MKAKTLKFLALACSILLVPSLVGCKGYEARKEAYYEKGKTLFEDGDVKRARLELKNALQIDNKHAPSWYLMGRIEEQNRDLRKAYASYQNALENDPDHTDSLVRRALLLILANDLEKATKDVDRVLAKTPNHPDALVARASLRSRQGDSAGAEADARSALATESGHVGATLSLASTLSARNEYNEAESVLQQAIELNPDEAALYLVLGRIQDTSGNVNGAMSTLKTLTEKNPDTFGFKVRLANYYAGHNRAADAEQLLRAALNQAPGDSERQRALLSLLGRVHGVATVEDELQSMLKQTPDSANLRFIQAGLALNNQDKSRAMQIYEEIVESANGLGPDAIKARNALAELLLRDRQFEQAEALVKTTLEEESSDSDALLLNSVIAMQKKDYDQAIVDLRALLSERPDRLVAWRMLAQAHVVRNEFDLAQDALDKALELAPDDQVSQSLLAQLKLNQGDADGARSVLESMAEQAPDNFGIHQALARIHFAQQDWGALAAGGEKLQETAPDQPLGPYLEGLGLQQQQRHAEAITLFEQALELRPRATEPLVALVQSLLAAGEQDKAEQRLQQVLKSDPGNFTVLSLLGNLYFSSGDIDRALQVTRTAVEQNPQVPTAHVRLFKLQATQQGEAGSVETLRRGAQVTDGNPLIMFELGSALERIGEYGEAIETYDSLLQKNPQVQAAVNNLAMLLATHKTDQASLDRALDLAMQLKDSDQAVFIDTVGWVHHKRGEYEQAGVYLQQANEMLQGNAEMSFHLGMNYLKLGNKDEARKYLNVAASSDDFSGREEAQEAIDRIAGQG